MRILTLDHTPQCMLIGMSSNGATASFQIGELAKRSQLTVDAIRFYERRRLLPTPIRTEGRFRLYTENDVERLRFVRQMQTLGFSLAEIIRLAQLRTDKDHACESVREFLKGKLAEVAAKIEELQQIQAELKTDLRKCNQALKQRRGKKACACPVLEQTEARH
ncbi:MAG: hypothetical protein NVS1B11_00010 [Terriglobales bacterium]